MSTINVIQCINKKCSVTNDDERFVVCWLCHGLCHFKCSGLSTLVAESLTKNNGLHWCCTNCRKIGVDFFRFFQGTKNKFLEIQKNTAAITESISAYGKLFEEYNSLSALKSPPETSPKRRKSSRIATKININVNDPTSSSRTDELTNNTTHSASTPVTGNYGNSPVIPFINQTNSFPPIIPAVHHKNPLIDQQNNGVPPGNQQINSTPSVNNNPPANIQNNSIPSVSNQININPSVNVQNNSYPSVTHEIGSTPSVGQENNSVNVDNVPLVVIPPNKSIFISRFAFETTPEQIESFIKLKLKSNLRIQVKKFSYSQPRDITSFKVTVPPEYFDQINSSRFWPNNVFVREYIFRQNQRNSNIAVLPSLESHSKN